MEWYSRGSSNRLVKYEKVRISYLNYEIGSAHTVLGAYWNKILTDKGRQEGDVIYAYQASPKRGGELLLKIMNEERIAIRGTARIVMEGRLNI